MRTFLGISKPSQALRAMVTGLLKAKADENCVVVMGDFGEMRDGVCHGCAATYALTELSGISIGAGEYPRKDHIGRALDVTREFDVTRCEVSDFECAVDCARQGQLKRLFDFFDTQLSDDVASVASELNMGTYDWKTQIPLVKRIIKLCEEAGC
jgi:hypothetical protein